MTDVSKPHAEMIRRTSGATESPDSDGRTLQPFAWHDVEAKLEEGPGPCWLSATGDSRPHVRPVFAAWDGSGFIFASNPAARKTALVRTKPPVSIAVDLVDLHLVVEGRARRVVNEEGLDRARRTLDRVFGWPTEVRGDLLDAEYAAPTSGGPPFEAYVIDPVRAFGFPTADQREPTRWTWSNEDAR